MSNQVQNPNKNKYDLLQRASTFSEDVIDFLKTVKANPINNPLISQLIRSATSIGANYCEADCAESKKDFQHKIGICKKEAKETMYWFQMIAKANPNEKEKCRNFWSEAHELCLIFSSIINNSKK